MTTEPQKSLMDRKQIRTELGWTDLMIREFLGMPDNIEERYPGYNYHLYSRDRVVAISQRPDVLAIIESVKRCNRHRLDGYAKGRTPIGLRLGMSARAVGAILDQLNLRVPAHPAMAAVLLHQGKAPSAAAFNARLAAMQLFERIRLRYLWHVERTADALLAGAPDAVAAAQRKYSRHLKRTGRAIRVCTHCGHYDIVQCGEVNGKERSMEGELCGCCGDDQEFDAQFEREMLAAQHGRSHRLELS